MVYESKMVVIVPIELSGVKEPFYVTYPLCVVSAWVAEFGKLPIILSVIFIILQFNYFVYFRPISVNAKHNLTFRKEYVLLGKIKYKN